MVSAKMQAATLPALHLTGISKRFGATQALDSVNLRVRPGDDSRSGR